MLRLCCCCVSISPKSKEHEDLQRSEEHKPFIEKEQGTEPEFSTSYKSVKKASAGEFVVKEMSISKAEDSCSNRRSKETPSNGQYVVFRCLEVTYLYVYYKDDVLKYEIVEHDRKFSLKNDLNERTHDSIPALIQHHRKQPIQLKNNKSVKLTKAAKEQ